MGVPKSLLPDYRGQISILPPSFGALRGSIYHCATSTLSDHDRVLVMFRDYFVLIGSGHYPSNHSSPDFPRISRSPTFWRRLSPKSGTITPFKILKTQYSNIMGLKKPKPVLNPGYNLPSKTTPTSTPRTCWSIPTAVTFTGI